MDVFFLQKMRHKGTGNVTHLQLFFQKKSKKNATMNDENLTLKS